MKVISVVGFHKSGKTTLVAALVESLKMHGRVGTIKHMPGHDVDHGDTSRHLLAGADVVIGLGRFRITVTRDWTLQSALEDLRRCGMDYVVIEGFKSSALPKIACGNIQASNVLRHVEVTELDDKAVEEIVELVRSLEDFEPCCMDRDTLD